MKKPYARPSASICTLLVLSFAFSSLVCYSQTSVIAWGNGQNGQTNVPPGLTNIIALAAGDSHNLALRVDGTVVGWGLNSSGQVTIPEGLNTVVAIAAGSQHSLALKADGTVVPWGSTNYALPVPLGATNIVAIAVGSLHNLALRVDRTVVAWGNNSYGEATVPPGLQNVVAIDAGIRHSVALKADGTVVAWGYNGYGQTNVPAGLNNVIAISAGGWYTLALKADGTVVGWGDNFYGQTASNILSSLTGVVAISAGSSHNLVLLEDGSVLSWGYSYYGQTNVPAGLPKVMALAAGAYDSLVLAGDGPPILGNVLFNQNAAVGATAQFHMNAKGAEPLFYQWRLNGIDLPDATNPILTLTSLQRPQAGLYSVVVSNAFGVVTSSAASLDILPLNIVTPPQRQEVLAGGSTSFTISLQSSVAVTYQWRFNGVDLPGATNQTLFLTNVQVQDAGAYSVAVSNAYGGTVSADGILDVKLIAGWGNNSYGKLSIPPGLTNVVAIAAGSMHNLALKADGTVAAWGNNSYNQTNIPPTLTNVVAIAAGSLHNLALKADGTVSAWGYNSSGQVLVPAGLSNVTAIAAANFYSMALKLDGTVVQWGQFTPAPTGLVNVVAIAAGQDHCLALKADGTVVAWGNDSYGQTDIPPGLSNVIAISAGTYNSFALKADGRVVGWGYNLYGSTTPPPSLTNAIAIAVGPYHCLALKADGTVIAWGYNGNGEILVPAGLSNVVAIAAGYDESLALIGNGPPFLTGQLANHTVAYGMNVQFHAPVTGARPLAYQWRFNGTNLPGATNALLALYNVQPDQVGFYSLLVSNAFGVVTTLDTLLNITPLWITTQPQSQAALVGTAVNFSVAVESALPVTYQWHLNNTNIPGATGSTLTLSNIQFDQAGTYAVFVSNSFGVVTSWPAALTVSAIVAWATPDSITYPPPLGLTNAVSIASGDSHSLALKGDGRVVGWGLSTYGQTNVPVGLSNVIAVACGATHSLALKQDGTLAAWGNYTYGATTIPPGLSNVAAIAAGTGFGLALRRDGTVVAWGNNSYGQTSVPPGLTNVVAIAAGANHSLALQADGSVVGWGDNTYYQITGLSSLRQVVAIAAGKWHSLALLDNGTVVAWGRSWEGQTYVPFALQNVIAIAGGAYHSVALKADGTVYTWGQNGYAEISVPTGISNIVAIAGGYGSTLVLAGHGPAFLNAPLINRNAVYGWPTPLYISATGGRTLTYQWRLDGTNLPGATNPIFIVPKEMVLSNFLCSVEVGNQFGAVTSTVALVSVVPLEISIQPQSQTNGLWANVSFSVAVHSSLPVFYQWRFQGENLVNSPHIAGANSATLGIHEVQFTDGGEYTVLITNQLGPVISRPAALTVTNDLPIFTCQPSSQYADAGYDAWFSVCVSSPLGYALQWFHDGIGIPGATNDTLNLLRVGTNDNGQYWCVASNRAGLNSSSLASLTVIYRAPAILSQPANALVDAGMDAVFCGNFSGAPYPFVQWQFNYHDIPGETNACLWLYAISSNHVGSYRFVLSNEVGVIFSQSATLSVMYRLPEIQSSPGSQSVRAGNYAYFYCDVIGGPKPDLQWLFNGQPIPRETNNYLNFLVTSTNQAGAYSLLATNIFGWALSDAAILTVITEPPVFSTQPISQGVLVGDSVQMTVFASGAPLPSYQWLFNGQSIPGETNSSLYLVHVTTNSTGDYVAVAMNEAGFATSAVARLVVSLPGPLDRWEWRNPLPQGNDLRCAASANGVFVAMGREGAKVRSTDGGNTWQCYSSGTADVYEMAYGNGIFVGLTGEWTGSFYISSLQASSDGVHWTNHDFFLENDFLNHITFGNGRFLGITYQGKFAISSNAVDWTITDNAGGANFWKVIFGGGLFYALSGNLREFATSSDGLSWTNQVPPTPGSLMDLAYGNGTLVLCGIIYTNYTPQSFAWVYRDGVHYGAYPLSPTNYVSQVAFDAGMFVAVSDVPNISATSHDGMNWNLYDMGVSNRIYDLVGSGGHYVGVGDKGAIVTSTNGHSWTACSPGSPVNLRSVARGPNLYVAVGNEGLVLTSSNGLAWNRHQAPTTYNLRSVACGNGHFVAVGDIETNQAVVLTSENGLDWFGPRANIYWGLYSITYGKGLFVAVGWNGAIATSPDGFSWTVQTPSPNDRMNAVTFNGDVFVAVGRHGAILSSTNGLNWIVRTSGSGNFFQGIASGNGLFVAAGQGGALAVSTNLINWTGYSYYPESPLRANIEDVQFANGLFIATGTDGYLATSPDGWTWTEHQTSCQNTLRCILYADGHLTVVGNNETILQSDFFGPPRFHVRPLSNDGFEFSMEAEVGCTYRLQASEDLTSWEDVFTFNNSRVHTIFLDSEIDSSPRRFYRVTSP